MEGWILLYLVLEDIIRWVYHLRREIISLKKEYYKRKLFPSQMINSSYYIFFYIIIVIIIFILVWIELSEHDCLPHKNCDKSKPNVQKGDDYLTQVDKISIKIRKNNNYIIWRQSLLVGLVAAFPIIILLKKRMPSPIEWVFVGLLIFTAAYFSNSWIWAHFYQPNSRSIEKNMLILRDHLQNQKQ